MAKKKGRSGQQSRRLVQEEKKAGVVKVIPIHQISPDPHQPRKEFADEELRELLASIENEGLQQLPTVNPAGMKSGEPHYIIKAGERRYRAHLLGSREEMACIVLPETYKGEYDVDRDIAQASENSCRVPHTHKEIILLAKRVLQVELASGETRHGAVGRTAVRLAGAFGKSRGWAESYMKLVRLDESLLALLDSKEDDECMNFQTACSLVVVPVAEQSKVYADALKRKAKGGHAAVRQYISEEARRIREGQGEKVRGKKPSDDRENLDRMINMLSRISNNFVGMRRSGEHKAFLKVLVSKMGTLEVDSSIHRLKESMVVFEELLGVLDERRVKLYSDLNVDS